jgi:DNA repair protein RecN (Recombination protein N)
LKDLAQYLIDIHGQHDQQAIFRVESHLQLLDRFGGEPVSAAWQVYLDQLQQDQACVREIASLGSDPAERARQIDLLQYQVDEINDAALQDGEDEKLTQRRRIIANAAKIRDALIDACELIAGDQPDSILARISQASARVDAANRQTGAFEEPSARLAEAMDLLEGAAADLRDFLDDGDADPQELERLDERLDVIFRLKKKYGGTLAAVLEFGRQAAKEHERLSGGEARYELLQGEKEKWRGKLMLAARRLSALRREAGARLEQLICSELADLGMKNASFEVHFGEIPDEPASFGRSGLDDVEFLLSANRGEPVRPLARIASGGEASRIMLAIKTILAQADRIPVLIFDEIDTGVSGRTAGKVGEKLLQLSSGRQVFCITHMAQIAAMADQHWLIEKNSDLSRTWTGLRELDRVEREGELARLLSGGIGDEAAHRLAESLLDQAKLTRRQA